MSDEDLDLEPIHGGGGRRAGIFLAVAAVAVGIAYFMNARLGASRRAEQLQLAANSWNALERCLVGENFPEGRAPGHLLRRTELAVPPIVRQLPGAQRRREWPYRCAPHASEMTHALFRVDPLDANQRILRVLVSRAASSLEDGKLRTGEGDRLSYVDEMFEVARRAGLPRATPARGPLPPDPVPPPLTARELQAIFRGNNAETLVTEDTTASPSPRAVLGTTSRRACIFPGTETFDSARCHDLTGADAPNRVELIQSANDELLVRFQPAGGATATLLAPPASTTTTITGDGGFASADRIWTIVREGTNSKLSTRARATSTEVPALAPIQSAVAGDMLLGPTLRGDRILALVATGPAITHVAPSSTDGGTSADVRASDAGAPAVTRPAALVAAVLPTAPAAQISLTEVGRIGALGAHPEITRCRTENSVAHVIRSDGDLVAVTFLTPAGTWTPIVEATVPSASIACRNAEVSFTWVETQPRHRIHQTRCTATGCQKAEGYLPEFENEPLVRELGGKILLVATMGADRALVFRVANLDGIFDAADITAVDNAFHGGLSIQRPERIFVRGDHAIVLVTSRADTHDTFAIRLDTDGGFEAVDRTNR